MKKNTKESLRSQINDTNAAVREKRRQRYASYRKKGSSEAGEKPSDFKGTLRRLLRTLSTMLMPMRRTRLTCSMFTKLVIYYILVRYSVLLRWVMSV